MKRDRLGLTVFGLLVAALVAGSAFSPQMCLADGPLVIDTFSRTPGPDLGTTEDTNHYPWLKAPTEGKATISGDQKLMLEEGAFTGVTIDTFRPGDFDMTLMMSVKKNWDGGWAGFVYRSEVKDAIDGQTGGTGRGFIFHIGGSGAHNILYIWSSQTGHLAGVDTQMDWSTPHKVRLRVVGDHHQVWLDDSPNPIIDVHNANNTSPGYFFFCRRDDGSTYDDLNIQSLDTFGTVTGIVKNATTNAPVSGAKVTVQDSVATTGADGRYTAANVVAGVRPISVLKDNYFPYSGTVEVLASSVVTRDVMLEPFPAPKVITDTFSRADSTEIGTTEDAGHYPWIKSDPASATGIVSQSLYFPEGSADSVTLGGFYPADFEVTAKWNSGSMSALGWSGISYRGSSRGGEDPAGYSLRIDPDLGDLFLRGHGTQLATATVPYPQVDFYNVPGPTVKIRATGNHHEVWVEGVKYIDYIDTDPAAKSGGGFVTMFRSGMYITADDFVLNSWRDAVAGSVSGTVTAGGSPVAGAEVSITGIASAATDGTGHYTLSGVVPGSHTVTASFPGYEPDSKVVAVPDGGSATQDFVLAPLPPGVIADTFSRDNNVELGTTEDSSHTAWLKGPGADAAMSIKDHTLDVLGNVGGTYVGAVLTGVQMRDFDVSFDMALHTSQSNAWVGLYYRMPNQELQAGGAGGTGEDGYLLHAGPTVLYDWSQPTGHIAGVGNLNFNVMRHVRLRVVGDSHKCWVDGSLVFDIHNSNNMRSGYLALMRCIGPVTFDNFRLMEVTQTDVPRISDLSGLEDGTLVRLTGNPIVAGKIPLVNFIYVEEADRSSGIKVQSAAAVNVGDAVEVIGELGTQNGERHITATAVNVASTGHTMKPMFVAGREFIAPGGLGVTGLLVTVAGTAVAVDVNFMEINDGSGANIWVWHEDFGASNPSVGDFVVLTGEAGKWDGSRPILWMRSPSDLIKVAP